MSTVKERAEFIGSLFTHAREDLQRIRDEFGPVHLDLSADQYGREASARCQAAPIAE